MEHKHAVRACFGVLLACLLTLTACGGGNGDDRSGDDITVPEKDVTFETEDGVTLSGRLFGTGPVGVTLAHEYPATDASGWYMPARELAQAGYTALAFTFRGYGDSEGAKQIAKAPVDVEAAAAELRDSGAKDVAYAGASMGGTASIIAAQNQEPLAVVAISAPTNFMGLDATIASTNVQRPVLLMASRGDQEAFSSLDEFERSLPNPENTKIYDGDAHGTSLFADTPEAIDEILTFLERYAPVEEVSSSPGSGGEDTDE
jgi:pimeloyl-ACP methyl ester carboxylesterase